MCSLVLPGLLHSLERDGGELIEVLYVQNSQRRVFLPIHCEHCQGGGVNGFRGVWGAQEGLIIWFEAKTSDGVIIGIVLVHHQHASVLFDLGCSFPHVSTYFAIGFDMTSDCMLVPIHVSTPVGESLVVDRVYQSYLVFWPAISSVLSVEWMGASDFYPSKFISFIRAQRLVDKGCLSYFIQDTTVETPLMDFMPVVQEFSYVFPIDLPSGPPDRDINFDNYLEPGTKSISITHNRMAQGELKELKD
ncbi:hypothetical protein MTR67_047933 [Solanum verrucosum]|uniref:Uncharacterized protein n=1 Tax=Solanum verrucosum TaxID=315347 RepID=A0AAF0UX25_SOLVR|nr:hypothetical protein MTR67_047933 [Solanum verrucosum]